MAELLQCGTSLWGPLFNHLALKKGTVYTGLKRMLFFKIRCWIKNYSPKHFIICVYKTITWLSSLRRKSYILNLNAIYSWANFKRLQTTFTLMFFFKCFSFLVFVVDGISVQREDVRGRVGGMHKERTSLGICYGGKWRMVKR